jgi:hypothetical protein
MQLRRVHKRLRAKHLERRYPSGNIRGKKVKIKMHKNKNKLKVIMQNRSKIKKK